MVENRKTENLRPKWCFWRNLSHNLVVNSQSHSNISLKMKNQKIRFFFLVSYFSPIFSYCGFNASLPIWATRRWSSLFHQSCDEMLFSMTASSDFASTAKRLTAKAKATRLLQNPGLFVINHWTNCLIIEIEGFFYY